MMTALVVMLAPTVAVMPFKDLSGGKGQVGEAIRETVTADLKDVPGLKVVERGSIDKVIAEQNLQAKKNDLDTAASIRVGTLLGATMIVAGAYQKAATSVRLTARFVKVETGEIVGSAKVDGNQGEFFTLQDQITVQLLKSAGLETQKQRFVARRRPKVKSFRALELYGDAVVQTDENKKLELLRASVSADPAFDYAVRDLDALERRMKQYQQVAGVEQVKALRELAREVQNEKDPQKLYMLYNQLMMKLLTQHRLRGLVAVCRAVIASPPPKWDQPGVYDLVEEAQANLVMAYETLKRPDDVLREGEKFLAKYPTSVQFSIVKMRMDNAIETKRKIDEGVRGAAQQLAQLGPQQRGNPCSTGGIYRTNLQYKEARRDLELCIAAGGIPHALGAAELMLGQVAWEQGDFRAARQYHERAMAVNPAQYRSLKVVADMIPVDE